MQDALSYQRLQCESSSIHWHAQRRSELTPCTRYLTVHSSSSAYRSLKLRVSWGGVEPPKIANTYIAQTCIPRCAFSVIFAQKQKVLMQSPGLWIPLASVNLWKWLCRGLPQVIRAQVQLYIVNADVQRRTGNSSQQQSISTHVSGAAAKVSCLFVAQQSRFTAPAHHGKQWNTFMLLTCFPDRAASIMSCSNGVPTSVSFKRVTNSNITQSQELVHVTSHHQQVVSTSRQGCCCTNHHPFRCNWIQAQSILRCCDI